MYQYVEDAGEMKLQLQYHISEVRFFKNENRPTYKHIQRVIIKTKSHKDQMICMSDEDLSKASK